MTPRQPRISGKDTVAALRRAGFIPVYIEGSHHYLEPAGGGALVTVPVHTNKILKPKTLKSIMNQAGLTIKAFTALLIECYKWLCWFKRAGFPLFIQRTGWREGTFYRQLSGLRSLLHSHREHNGLLRFLAFINR